METTGTIFQDASTQIQSIAGDAAGLLTDNIWLLMALPIGFVVFRVIKRVVSKVG